MALTPVRDLMNLATGIRPSTVPVQYIQIAIQRGDRLNRTEKLEV
jgi:hypothetical protein